MRIVTLTHELIVLTKIPKIPLFQKFPPLPPVYATFLCYALFVAVFALKNTTKKPLEKLTLTAPFSVKRFTVYIRFQLCA